MPDYEIDERDLDNAEQSAREREREAIVAWLRAERDRNNTSGDDCSFACADTLDDAAKAIERGEHLLTEELG